jgi:hypothetical protein
MPRLLLNLFLLFSTIAAFGQRPACEHLSFLFVGPSDKTPTSLMILNAASKQEGCKYDTAYISSMFLKWVTVDSAVFNTIREFAEHHRNTSQGNTDTFNQMSIGYKNSESGYIELAYLQPAEQETYFNKLRILLRENKYLSRQGVKDILEWSGY